MIMTYDLPLVSVIVPVYNQSKYIEETLSSIMEQSYSNIEVLISDDCSTDSSVEIISSFLNSYLGSVEIKFFKQESNLGISKNINFLIENIKGVYLVLFSGDDLMMPDKIHKQVSLMLNDAECSICYHDVVVFDSSNNKRLCLYSDRHKPREGGADELIANMSFNCGCSTMMKMENKVFCDTKIKFSSDWLHCIELLIQSSGKIMYINEVLGKYRRHETNITKINNMDGYQEVFETLDILSDKFPEYQDLIISTKAERLMTYSIKVLLSGFLFKSIKLFFRGLVMKPSSFFKFVKNTVYYIRSSR